MSAELNVKIGAEVGGLEKGASKAEKALSNVTKRINQINKDIAQNITISQGYEKAIQDLTRAFKAGDISQKQYSKSIQRLRRDEKETEIETKRLRTELRNLNREQKDLSSVIGSGGSAMGKFGKTTRGNAVPAVQEFSRVIQDAPYGIQGVANNIQQLTAQFGYLQKSAGGTKAALKLMLSSLAGPAGILLAVSLATAALVQFGDELFDSGEEAESAADKLQDYVDSLRGVDSAQLKGAQSAAKEIIQLKLLSSQATNTALSMDKRTSAVNELKKLYPSYLGNMTDEKILTEGLRDSYNELSASILNKARAQASAELIVENQKKQLALESQLITKQEELRKAEEKSNITVEEYDKLLKTTTARQNDAINAYSGQIEKVKELRKEVNSLTGQKQGLELENIELEKNIKVEGGVIIDPDKSELKDGKDLEVDARAKITSLDVTGFKQGSLNIDVNADTQALVEFTKAVNDQISYLEKLRQGLPETSTAYKNLTSDIELLKASMGSMNEVVSANLDEFASTYGENLSSVREEINKTQETADLFANSVSHGISSMGDVLAESFAKQGGIFNKFAGVIASTLSSLLSQLAQSAIKNIAIKQAESTAGAVKAGTETASATGPAAAFVLPGLVAAMVGFVGSAFSGIKGFQFGGYVGDQNLVRMNGNERILTPTQAITYENQQRGNNYMSQRVKVDIGGEWEIRGSSLVKVIGRENKTQSRIGN